MAPNGELISLDVRLHKVARVDLVNAATDHRIGKLLSTLVRVHSIVIDEMARRGLRHEGRDDALKESARKIRSDFGEFTQPVPVDALPVILLDRPAAQRVIDGKVSFLSIPSSPVTAEILSGSASVPTVLVGGARAIGRAILKLPPARSGNGPRLPATERVRGSGKRFSVAFTFVPFVSPVEVKVPRNGSFLASGLVTFVEQPLEKVRDQIVDRPRDAAAEAIAQNIGDVCDTPTSEFTFTFLQSLKDGDLLNIADILRDRARRFFEEGTEPEDLVNAMIFLLAVADERGLKVETDDPLDRVARKQVQQVGKDAGRPEDPAPAIDQKRAEFLHRNLPESLVVIPSFVSVSGSQIYPHRDKRAAADVDVIYRCPEGSLGLGGLALKLERALQEVAEGVPINHIASPEGPAWSSLPIYDLVLIRRQEAKVEVVRESFSDVIKRRKAAEAAVCCE